MIEEFRGLTQWKDGLPVTSEVPGSSRSEPFLL
jgi:hypothetical protein